VFSGIAIADRPAAERCCGVWVVNIQSGRVIAYVKFEDALQEIFAVQALPRRRPDVLNDDATRLAESFVVPDEVLAEVAEPFRRLGRAAVA
jgi:hypothetical protein